MLLFRGEFGTRLYTGDFRWETTCERTKASRTMLLDALNGDGVDLLYLDNTYCNPSYAFPSREVAAQQVHHAASNCISIKFSTLFVHSILFGSSFWFNWVLFSHFFNQSSIFCQDIIGERCQKQVVCGSYNLFPQFLVLLNSLYSKLYEFVKCFATFLLLSFFSSPHDPQCVSQHLSLSTPSECPISSTI